MSFARLERAQVDGCLQIFHAASWNYDWTKLKLGDHENYDAFIMFKRIAQLTSGIKPLYGFTGGILEYIFFHSERRKIVDREARTMTYIGDGDEQYIYIAVDDLAAYTVAAIESPHAASGGCYYVESFRSNARDFADIYGKTRAFQMGLKCVMDNGEAQAALAAARQKHSPTEWPLWIGLAYATLINNGKMMYESIDSEKWTSEIKQTSFERWLTQHPEA